MRTIVIKANGQEVNKNNNQPAVSTRDDSECADVSFVLSAHVGDAAAYDCR